MVEKGHKNNLKMMMQQMGVTYQQVADHSGISKADVSRVLNGDMEEKVIDVVCKLIKERNKNIDKTLAPFQQ
jgi:transcriptional regulator with XRE-family HTH domain